MPENPITTARRALTELRSFGSERPARAQVLLSKLQTALDAQATDQHLELYLAMGMLLRDIDNPEARTRAYYALGALDEHYSVNCPSDFDALNVQTLAERQHEVTA